MSKTQHIKQVAANAIKRPEQRKVKIHDNPIHGSANQYPAWRFSTVDKEGPFKWPINQAAETEILNKLRQFDSMTWAELSGKEHHTLSAQSLSKQAQRRLALLQRDHEIDLLFSFRLQGKPRVICIKHGSTALLLWYDPEHKVCPSHKKNT